jgi:N-acetylglucosaminyl-diphospho-decaprenol L-rhamnosyltransferase
MTFVTAIVVAADGAAALPRCIDALVKAGLSTIVVDDASAVLPAGVVAADGVRILRNERPEGFGRSANRGARATDAQFILVVRPEVVLEPGAVSALLGAARRYPESGFFAPRLIGPGEHVVFHSRSLVAPYLKNPGGQLHEPEGDACAPFFPGACFLIKRDLFLRLGGFDEKIVESFEDEDLCRRVADSSPGLIYVPTALARISDPQPGSAALARQFRSGWHQAWSRAYVSRKYRLPNPAPRLFLANAAKAVGAGLILKFSLAARSAGAAAGAWAFMAGRTALGREGLVTQSQASDEVTIAP